MLQAWRPSWAISHTGWGRKRKRALSAPLLVAPGGPELASSGFLGGTCCSVEDTRELVILATL